MGLLIGEVARRTGVSTSALRFYERAGLVPPPRRVSKRRVYDAQVTGRIRIILLARRAGFTVMETKTFLSGYPPGTTPAQRWQVLAASKLAELDAQIGRLAEMKSLLQANFRGRCIKLDDCEKWMAAPRTKAK